MKPILFNTEMVRAILNGCKMVTRRVVKPQPLERAGNPHEINSGDLYFDIPDRTFGGVEASVGPYRPPYRPGDILYVRETFFKDNAGRYHYKADDDLPFFEKDIGHGLGWAFVRWRPSIHMPKEAARIFLRVTWVRVQQLKDVTEEDARAEGFGSRSDFMATILKMYPDSTAESWFWVIEFERISAEEAKKGDRT